MITTSMAKAQDLLNEVDRILPSKFPKQASSPVAKTVEKYLTNLHKARQALTTVMLEAPEGSPLRTTSSQLLGKVTYLILAMKPAPEVVGPNDEEEFIRIMNEENSKRSSSPSLSKSDAAEDLSTGDYSPTGSDSTDSNI